MSDDDDEVGVRLGALLEPVLHTIVVRKVTPDPQPPPKPKPQFLDELELMALIFAHLDHENPRVCEGIEFERFEILSEPASVERTRSVVEPEPVAAASPTPRAKPLESESTPAMLLELEQRIGAAWADDIAAVPSDWLEQPELTAAQQQLLVRVQRRALATLNLRRLDRPTALRHVELFVRACQARRLAWCRIITGKGIGSAGEPVLKRAVLEWCRGPGRKRVLEWAPELDPHREWGVLVLRLSSATVG